MYYRSDVGKSGTVIYQHSGLLRKLFEFWDKDTSVAILFVLWAHEGNWKWNFTYLVSYGIKSSTKSNTVNPRITSAPFALVSLLVNHKQMIIYSFKHCTLTVAVDGSEDLLIYFLRPNQPCAAGLDWLKGLYYIVLHETQDPSETETYIYYKKTDISYYH